MACNFTAINIATADNSTALRTYRISVISISTMLIIIGNVSNIYILPRMNSLNKINKIFFVNLSIADMMVGLSVGLPALVTTIANDVWLFGEPYCYISGLLHMTSINVSMTTLTALSIVRYIAVTRPFQYRMISWRKCLFACSILWLYCSVVSVSPLANKATIVGFALQYGFCTVCWVELWSALLPFFIILLPCFISLMVSGIKIIGTLRRNQIPGELTCSNNSLRRDKKATSLIIVTTVCFGACWLPYVAVVCARMLIPSMIYDMSMIVKFSALWLGNANSFINVCIYSSIYPEYRKKLKQILLFRRQTDRVLSDGSARTAAAMTSAFGYPEGDSHAAHSQQRETCTLQPNI